MQTQKKIVHSEAYIGSFI